MVSFLGDPCTLIAAAAAAAGGSPGGAALYTEAEARQMVAEATGRADVREYGGDAIGGARGGQASNLGGGEIGGRWRGSAGMPSTFTQEGPTVTRPHHCHAPHCAQVGMGCREGLAPRAAPAPAPPPAWPPPASASCTAEERWAAATWGSTAWAPAPSSALTWTPHGAPGEQGMPGVAVLTSANERRLPGRWRECTRMRNFRSNFTSVPAFHAKEQQYRISSVFLARGAPRSAGQRRAGHRARVLRLELLVPLVEPGRTPAQLQAAAGRWNLGTSAFSPLQTCPAASALPSEHHAHRSLLRTTCWPGLPGTPLPAPRPAPAHLVGHLPLVVTPRLQLLDLPEGLHQPVLHLSDAQRRLAAARAVARLLLRLLPRQVLLLLPGWRGRRVLLLRPGSSAGGCGRRKGRSRSDWGIAGLVSRQVDH